MNIIQNDFYRYQQIAVKIVLDNVHRVLSSQEMKVDCAYLNALEKTLSDKVIDKSFMTLLLTLPNEQYIAESMKVIEPLLIHQASRFVKRAIAQHQQQELLALYHENDDLGDYGVSAEAIGRRSIKNLCLSYLCELDENDYLDLAWRQFERGRNMTDELAAFQVLVHSDLERGTRAIRKFYDKWRHDVLVLDKWFQAQALSRLPGGVERIRALMAHPQFNIKNPNKVRALIGAFSQANSINFHQQDGAGYELLGDCIVELDAINPQVAARLIGGFGLWKRYDKCRQLQMKKQLERIIDRPEISRDSYDVVQRLLA